MHPSAGLWHFTKAQCKSVLKPIVHRWVEYGLKVPIRYNFQWRKTTVGWLQRVTWKKRCRVRLRSIAFLQNCKMKSKWVIIVLRCKKMFLFEKIENNVQFNSLFLGIPKILICVLVGGWTFYLRNEKSCPSEEVSSLGFPL